MTGSRHRGLLASLVSLWLFTASPARAEGEAEALFRAGTAAFESGQYDAALQAYEQAYAIEALPETAFSIGQAARLSYFLARDPALLDVALDAYGRYLEGAPRGRRRAHAVQHIAALEALRAMQGTFTPGQRPTFLLVTSHTEGAVARIEDGDFQPVPLAAAVSPGEHRVEVVAPGFEPAERRLTARAEQLVAANVDLVARPGRVEIAAQSGAVLFVDGVRVGVAPLEDALSVPPGRHDIVARKVGREPRKSVLEVEPGARRRVELEPQSTTDAHRAALGLLASGSLSLGGALVSGVVALVSEQRALAVEAELGARPLSAADLERHATDVRLRDDAAIATVVLGGAGGAAVATGIVVWTVDASQTSPSAFALRPGPGLAGGSLEVSF